VTRLLALLLLLPSLASAPFGMTIPAGLWSGAGCRLKSCVELYGFQSYPPECPL